MSGHNNLLNNVSSHAFITCQTLIYYKKHDCVSLPHRLKYPHFTVQYWQVLLTSQTQRQSLLLVTSLFLLSRDVHGRT